ncbi:glycosyltransferase [Cytobacillus oceanisediminis]|uniref:glycosyltransferase n=1 Tax=Cytobacillus oceanisediminis TaxID=665099 RepID=UPI001C227915|nr:glycosyltransferase [Cytobacillus oceanisediminis]MBU8772837.1 glycosyltransferase [Cytobacillus oceanisediminis]
MEHREYPLVSIIIPFYNCKYISRAISSSIKQTYPNIEVIVVDDGSTHYLPGIKPFKDRISYIRKKNGGTASALNEGIRKSKGNYIAWLSSDDIFINTKVETQLDFMKRGNYLFSYTNYYCINGKDKIISESVGPSNSSTEVLLNSLKLGCPINGSTIMMKREVFESIGLFDESLIYANDYDYWFRVLLNYEIGHLNIPLSLYRVHRNMGSKRYIYEVQKESVKVKSKYKEDLELYIKNTFRRHQ